MGIKRATGFLAAGLLVLAAPAAGANGNGRIAYESGGSIYAADPVGGAPTLLRAGFDPEYSPDGTLIAYGETPSGNVFVANADGSKPVLVATDHYLGPLAWSPDGKRIAYISGSYSSGFAVSVAKADGSGSSVVSQDASSDAPPSWSPDGTQLAFATTKDADLAVVNADGSGRRLLIQDATQDDAPSWSPDGSRIAFFRGVFGSFVLYTIRPDGSGRRLLIQDATQDDAPSWSPDGSRIAFFRGVFGSFVLYTIRPDGSGLHQIGVAQVDPDSQPAWSPDSTRLVFGARQLVAYTKVGPEYRYDVYTVAADGGGERRLSDGSYPGWAPDGRRIAFTSVRRGSFARQLYVMNADGTCQTQLTSGIAAVSSPSWQAATAPPAEPLRCAALSLSGTLTAATDHPALDDVRIYVYRATITNNGNTGSDPLRFTTSDQTGPFAYISAAASGGDCKLGADVTCSLPPLAAGASATVELRFNAFIGGALPFEAQVAGTGQTPDGDLSDNVDDQYRRFPFCDISTQDGSIIRAGNDDDLICGTVGRDNIFAGGGNDRVSGGPGHDTIHAGTGDDQVDGGGGTDYVYGERGADKLHGGNGDDVLIGGDGNDVLWGDAGGDYLKGGPGVDRFFGGDGNDVIDSRDGLTEHVYCGEGNDTVQADLRDIVSPDCEKVVRKPAQARAPR
jgi:Tol biopolymer transport system component